MLALIKINNIMEITTNTIAELYIKQGYPEKAMDIYKAILELDPGNETARDKLTRLEAQKSNDENSGVENLGASSAQVTHLSPVVADESLPVANDVASQIDRLEGWLSTITRAGRRA